MAHVTNGNVPVNQSRVRTGERTTSGAHGPLVRFWAWLPDRVDSRVRVLGWLSLIWQVILVGTGGAVRLTGSGLGCTTWPKCTAGSLVTTPEMGIHGVIEFTNRMLTVVLTIVVIVMFVLVLRLRKSRPELFWLSFWIGMSIPVQAVIGGITVLMHLNPYVVGFHFLVSMVLVALAAALLLRVYAVPGPRALAVPGWFAFTAWSLSAFVAITVVLGVLTSGSGPHPGNSGTPRNGLDTDLMERLHSLPAYVTAGLTLLLIGAAIGIAVGPVRRWLFALVVVEIVQIGVGLLQSNIGLPGYLVGIHLVLASILVSVAVAMMLNLKQPTLKRQ
ncbi:MAG: heme A synthase [Microbacteriaceae bacterium]|nr:MAG: heme A synthase [Microbacteriaceae bacterium]